jgi:glycosyltransferase involved in cell wall biosynthesis
MKDKVTKKTISVVLATRNEEQFLSDCLKSVESFADEIIVVDEQSQDDTKKIARSFRAKVFDSPHHPIFHVTKNIAISKATSDWILQLDADERCSPELTSSIKKLLNGEDFGSSGWISPLRKRVNRFMPIFKDPQKLSEPASAYWLTRRNLFLKRFLTNSGQYPDPLIRLFMRGKAILPARDVHEQMEVKGNIGWLEGDIIHISSPTLKRYLEREDRYSSLLASDLERIGIRISLMNNLKYLFYKPLSTFINIFIRRRGFIDGFQGFVFALFSGLHHAFGYMKLWERQKHETKS